MEELRVEAPESASKPVRSETISYTKALVYLLLLLFVLGSGGYALGKYKFWKTYDTTPRLDRMEALYTEKAKGDPNNPGNYVDLGYVYYQKQEYEKAAANYKKAISLDDKHYKAHYNLGVTYVAMGRAERAVQEFQKAIEIAPKAQGAHLSLGMLYLTEQKYDKAEPELDAAYRANPGDAELLYNLGIAKEKLGKLSEAQDVYKQVVALMPDHAEGKAALTRVEQLLKDQKK